MWNPHKSTYVCSYKHSIVRTICECVKNFTYVDGITTPLGHTHTVIQKFQIINRKFPWIWFSKGKLKVNPQRKPSFSFGV